MTREQIRDWIVQSFLPDKLSLPYSTMDLVIDNSITYWNTHSAYKIVRMVDSPAVGSGARGATQITEEIKTVVKVYPSAMQEELFSNHPMWVLLGFITLDKYTQDLMLLSNTFEGYRIYLGNDFRWKWIRSDDSTKGGWLHVQEVPRNATKLAVVGTKRVLAGEDIKDEFIFNWIREYARAMTKIYEGSVLRKGQIIGINNDGGDLVREGKEEKKELEEKLRLEARWLFMAIRK